MYQIVAITRCIKVENNQSSFFHFHGFVRGDKCSMIKVRHDFYSFCLKRDYILTLNLERVINGVAYTDLVKSQPFDDVRTIF